MRTVRQFLTGVQGRTLNLTNDFRGFAKGVTNTLYNVVSCVMIPAETSLTFFDSRSHMSEYEPTLVRFVPIAPTFHPIGKPKRNDCD